jgi:hypothetical protein
MKHEDLSSIREIVTGLFNQSGEVYGTLIFVPTTSTVMNPVFESREDKDKFTSLFMVPYCRKNYGTNFYMASEAWMSTAPADADLSKVPMPSENPDRQEIIMVTEISLLGDLATMAPIIREGDSVSLGEWAEEWRSVTSPVWDRCIPR